MAVGMKGWLGITALALLLVLGWGLSPVQRYPEARKPLPERMEFLDVNEELALEAWTYQRLFRRDTLVAALMAGVASGEDIIIGLPAETPDSTVEKVRRALARQMNDLGIDRPAMPVGLFAVATGAGAYPGQAEPFSLLSGNDEIYLARDGEPPFCLIASPFRGYREDDRFSKGDAIASRLRFRTNIPRDPRQPINLFGICRFFARHGSPGTPMLTWFQSGASAFAREVFSTNHHLRLGQGPARGPFGKAGGTWMGGSPRTELCLAGEPEMCEALLLDLTVRPAGVQHMEFDPRDLINDSPVDLIPRYPQVARELLGNQGVLFSLLEEEFGADRFGAFWRSDLPVPEAFEAAFGKPLDQWVMEWLRRYVDPPARGPGVPAQATLLTLLGFGLLAGGAVRMGRR